MSVRKIVFVGHSAFRISLATTKPSIRGMEISRMANSGWSRSVCSSASTPSLAVATISYVSESIARTREITLASSSAHSTVARRKTSCTLSLPLHPILLGRISAYNCAQRQSERCEPHSSSLIQEFFGYNEAYRTLSHIGKAFLSVGLRHELYVHTQNIVAFAPLVSSKIICRKRLLGFGGVLTQDRPQYQNASPKLT